MADSKARAAEFVTAFVGASDKYRRQYIDRWEEIVRNFVVQPEPMDPATRSPYRRGGLVYNAPRRRVILKDGETHKVVMTHAAQLMTQLFGHPRGEYIQAVPVGYEDAPAKGPTVSRLLRYANSLPGHYRTYLEAITDMLLFGTSVVEVVWKYEEREMPVRTVTQTPFGEMSEETRQRIPVYDDVCIRPLDVLDFYPDPARYRMQEMCGAAKRYRMNAYEARRMADAGLYDAAAVERAIGRGSNNAKSAREESFRVGLDQPTNREATSQFQEFEGFEYWGEVPWYEDGSSRRVLTVLNGETVRDRPYPLADAALPFHTFIINPVQGRFYGISPAEVIRYDQSFADAIKMLLAEAIIRQVHPPIAVDPDAIEDIAAVKAWRTDAVIMARGGPSGIGTLRYDANVNNGFAMLSGLKAAMQDDSGANAAVQGMTGPDREAATVGAERYKFAGGRLELAAQVIEKECLPPIGKAILSRYQQFLQDTEDLQNRVGQMPEPVWLGDVMGDFDIQFVGSRMMAGRQQKLQAWDRLTALSASNPVAASMIPWPMVLSQFIGDVLDLPEVAGSIADPQTMMQNLALSQLVGGQGGPAQNGVPPSPEPAGALPAQMAGGPTA